MFRSACAMLLAAAVMSSPISAQDKAKRPVAMVRSPFDTINERQGKTFVSLPLNTPLFPGVKLLTPPGLRGQIDAKEGDLRLTLIGDLPGLGASQSLETAAALNDPADVDLDITLVRGLALCECRADKGNAKVRIRVDDKKLDVELLGKGSTVAVELISRWPEGVPFLKKPDPKHLPLGELLFFVLKGKAEVTLESEKSLMQAPILYRWTSRMGVDGPIALKQPPDWASARPAAKLDKDIQALLAAAEKVRFSLEKKKLADLAADPSPAVRQLVIYRQAAQDELPAVIAALNKDAAAEVRRAAATALRHYSGRGHAQDQEVYQALLAADWKAGQGQIFMHLLHGFSPEEKRRPETYDALIGYLQSAQVGTRELAHLTLLSLAPQGRDIAFDAAADTAARTAAQAAWRKLIPEGKTPTPEKKAPE